MFHRLRVVIDKFTTFHRCLFVYWRVKLAVFARNPARKYPKGKFSCSFTSPISHQEWAVNGSIKVMGPMASDILQKRWNLSRNCKHRAFNLPKKPNRGPVKSWSSPAHHHPLSRDGARSSLIPPPSPIAIPNFCSRMDGLSHLNLEIYFWDYRITPVSYSTAFEVQGSPLAIYTSPNKMLEHPISVRYHHLQCLYIIYICLDDVNRCQISSYKSYIMFIICFLDYVYSV